MNMPGYAAEASLHRMRTLYRGHRGYSGMVGLDTASTVVPAQIWNAKTCTFAATEAANFAAIGCLDSSSGGLLAACLAGVALGFVGAIEGCPTT